MKQHALMTVAIALILIGCASGPSREDLAADQGFFDKIRDCGKAATVARVEGSYVATFAKGSFEICGIKICNPKDLEKVLVVDKLDIDKGSCTAEFRAEDRAQ